MNIKMVYLLMVMLAFLGGAFIAVLDPVTVNWVHMGSVLTIGAIGLVFYRQANKSEASASHRLSGNMQLLGESLANVLANLEQMCVAKSELPVYEARFEIDRLFREDLNNFAEARETMIHVFGMQKYADVMSAFAAGERYINRVWSASTDGYENEVHRYLEKARTQFDEADGLFRQLQSEASFDATVSAT
jgi:hypothetical protein